MGASLALVSAAQRLSWRNPNNVLFLCRVRNISSHCLGVSGLGALGLPYVKDEQEQQRQHGGGGGQEDFASKPCVVKTETPEERSDAAAPGLLPLVPYRGTPVDKTNADDQEACQRVLAPGDELNLLYAPQDPESLQRLAEAGEYAARATTKPYSIATKHVYMIPCWNTACMFTGFSVNAIFVAATSALHGE